jgi:hypothetical protein
MVRNSTPAEEKWFKTKPKFYDNSQWAEITKDIEKDREIVKICLLKPQRSPEEWHAIGVVIAKTVCAKAAIVFCYGLLDLGIDVGPDNIDTARSIHVFINTRYFRNETSLVRIRNKLSQIDIRAAGIFFHGLAVLNYLCMKGRRDGTL